MAPDAMHIVNGIDAVIDSANAVTPRDIWVDVEDVPETLRQIKKLGGFNPRVYPAREESKIADKSVCIELRD